MNNSCVIEPPAVSAMKAFSFYSGQMTGRIPQWSPFTWRGDTFLNDGFVYQGRWVDLSGSWFDCGDHVVFGLPLAFTSYTMGFILSQYALTLKTTGNWDTATQTYGWIIDWWKKAHLAPSVLVAQVGDGVLDHVWWGPPEFSTSARPVYLINETRGGADLAGAVSATFSFASLVFPGTDSLKRARQLYDFAVAHPERYSQSVPPAAGFYSSSGSADETLLAGLALWNAEGCRNDTLKQWIYTRSRDLVQKTLTWTHCWDDASYMNLFLLCTTRIDPTACNTFLKWATYWTTQVPRTPKGMAWLTGWGSLRYPVSSAFLMMAFSDAMNISIPVWDQFALQHYNYVLGNNEQGTSYVVGGGKKWFQRAHHRGAHGSWNNSMFSPALNRHINYELLGGPDINGNFQDDRTNYVYTEGGNDMQIGWVGLSVALSKRCCGGKSSPLPREIPTSPEFWAEITSVSLQTQSAQINLLVHNNAGWAPRAPQISVLYFFNRTHSVRQGVDLVLSAYYKEGALISDPAPWNNSPIWSFINITFLPGVLGIGSTTVSQKQVQLTLHYPYGTPSAIVADWSYDWSLREPRTTHLVVEEKTTVASYIHSNGLYPQ